MIHQVTSGIKISVDHRFEGTFYKDYQLMYAFEYTITIENLSQSEVQLHSRHWIINDALHIPRVVKGPGVVGLQPHIIPGDKHQYTSGCELHAPFGTMKGYYLMVNKLTQNVFNVSIPKFQLFPYHAVN